jgi:hypothetical protein
MNEKFKEFMKSSDGDKELGYALAKGFVSNLSLIPVIGPMAAEAIGTKIPNVRMQRVETMVTLLYEYLGIDGSQIFNDKINEEDFRNLFEQAVEQASKAKAVLRIKMIARLLASGITVNNEDLFFGTVLDVIESLSDTELTIFSLLQDARETFGGEGRHFVIREGDVAKYLYDKTDRTDTYPPDFYEVFDIVQFVTTSLQSKALIRKYDSDTTHQFSTTSDAELLHDSYFNTRWTYTPMGIMVMQLTQIRCQE